MSCIFYGEREAVATFKVNLPAEGRRAKRSRIAPAPILVKGCESRFNIERLSEIRLCTPSYYREDGGSLVWDQQECVVSLGPRGEERRDDPDDLERFRRLDAERADRDPLRMAVGQVTSNSVEVIERVDTSLVYGDNCLIWCSATKPESKAEWSAWWSSLEDSYDDYSTIRDPHSFAQALGAMAFQQRGMLGNPISFANPCTGQVTQSRCLPVVYGPVVYVEDRRAYIEESLSEAEFIVRSIFTKTLEHRPQREYRFAVLMNRTLEDETILLKVSPEMRAAMRTQRKAGAAMKGTHSPVFGGKPAPEIYDCFAIQPSPQRGVGGAKISMTTQMRANIRLTCTYVEEGGAIHKEERTVETVNHEAIRRAINEEPTSPGDARIARFSFGAGPGNTFSIYSLKGISGTYRLANKAGKVSLEANHQVVPGSGDGYSVLIDLAGFSGDLDFESGTTRATLSATPINPAATPEFHLPDDGIQRQALLVVATDVIVDGLG